MQERVQDFFITLDRRDGRFAAVEYAYADLTGRVEPEESHSGQWITYWLGIGDLQRKYATAAAEHLRDEVHLACRRMR